MIFDACVRAIIYIIAYARAIVICNIRKWKILNFFQAKRIGLRYNNCYYQSNIKIYN